jgi:hypothetical protein
MGRGDADLRMIGELLQRQVRGGARNCRDRGADRGKPTSRTCVRWPT